MFAEGGRLLQYATPAELLGHPADDFVADFVGADARPPPAVGDPDRPRPPRAGRRRRHRRARRGDRPRRHPRGGPRRHAARRPGDGRRDGRRPGSSASSPPPASTGRSARASLPTRHEERRRERRLSDPRLSSEAVSASSTCCASRPGADLSGLGCSVRRCRLRGQAVAMSSSDLRVAFSVRSTSISSSSSATRTMAWAARSSASSRATPSRRPSASASRPAGLGLELARADSAARPCDATTARLELSRRLVAPGDLGLHVGGERRRCSTRPRARRAPGRPGPARPGRRAASRRDRISSVWVILVAAAPRSTARTRQRRTADSQGCAEDGAMTATAAR